MFDPKVIALMVLIILAAAAFVWVAARVIERFTRDKFKCAHCRRRCDNRDRDTWFADGICKTCGEYLIPHENRQRRN